MPTPVDRYSTHVVENQVPPPPGVNAFEEDPLLVELVAREAPWAADRCAAFGAVVADPATAELARQANRNLPELRTHDAQGRRLDQVDYHPAYHQCMSLAFGHGVHALAWTAGEPGAHVARAALSYLWNQVENGTACPTGMAYAAVPGLRAEEALAPWAGKLTAFGYDPRSVPAEEKAAVTVGYAMTEKQGGSDLRANQTTAVPTGRRGHGEAYLVTGHKWFCSAPMSDGFFVLAATEARPGAAGPEMSRPGAAGPEMSRPGAAGPEMSSPDKSGISCFFLPRILPDGTRNRLHFQRLKDKCGNRSNASSEVELAGAWGTLVGDEGRGISTILTSAHFTRLDFAVGSAGLERAAVSLALHHAEHRLAFAKPLVEHDSMRRTLADLIVEWEGATRLAFRLAAAADSGDESERLLVRLLTPVAKYWNCKRVALVVEEALECVGGNAYVEEHPLARLYREAPLNSVWEGTSNMMAMDVERCLEREPKALEVLVDEVRLAAGAHRDLDRALQRLEDLAPGRPHPNARAVTTLAALAMQGSLLARYGSPESADAFCASRLGDAALPGFGVAEFSRSQMDRIVEGFRQR